MAWKNNLAPRLRHRVDIERPEEVLVSSETGAVRIDWLPFRNAVPAEVAPHSGREFVAAQALQAGVTTRITIRHDDDVLPTMRVLHGGAIYNIKAVLPDPTFRHHFTLMCEEGVNHG